MERAITANTTANKSIIGIKYRFEQEYLGQQSSTPNLNKTRQAMALLMDNQ
jgi:hypothetical protein